MSEVSRTPTCTRAYADSTGFLTVLSDGERLTGAQALGPEAARVVAAGQAGHPRPRSAGVLRDTIQPFPTFSEIYVAALKALRGESNAALGRPQPQTRALRLEGVR
jgi:dihydrolipoamide dehydrogenase